MINNPPNKTTFPPPKKIVQNLIQEIVKKAVQKIVQGSNGPVHILPYAMNYCFFEEISEISSEISAEFGFFPVSTKMKHTELVLIHSVG